VRSDIYRLERSGIEKLCSYECGLPKLWHYTGAQHTQGVEDGMSAPDAKKEYLVISRGQWDDNASKEEVQRAIDAFYHWFESNLQRGRMKAGSRLAKDGKIVSKFSVTDGPFAETKELIGGFWFIVAGSLEEAAALAAENPCMAYGLNYEIRPLEAEKAVATSVTNETPAMWRSR
jgi:hypothetical protein